MILHLDSAEEPWSVQLEVRVERCWTPTSPRFRFFRIMPCWALMKRESMAVPEPIERTVVPGERPREYERLLRLLTAASGSQAELVSPDGERASLPQEVYEILRDTVDALARGQAGTSAPHGQMLTTQEAANLLGISRPTLVSLLMRGEIPYEQPGRHRRVLLEDVLAYQECRRREQAVALDELVELSEDLGLYDEEPPAPPARRTAR
jgi:excisionase family DNA binding protein